MRVLHSEAEIAERVRALGAEITARHRGRSVLLVPVLKGSFVFAADLARAIDLETRIDFLGVRSYGSSTTTSGVVETTLDLGRPIADETVILVEDIVDTGLTMKYLLDRLSMQRPASLELAALLHKPSRTRVEVPIDYLGFTIPDVFVVGYGLDANERFRNLPYLAVLDDAG